MVSENTTRADIVLRKSLELRSRDFLKSMSALVVFSDNVQRTCGITYDNITSFTTAGIHQSWHTIAIVSTRVDVIPLHCSKPQVVLSYTVLGHCFFLYNKK